MGTSGTGAVGPTPAAVPGRTATGPVGSATGVTHKTITIGIITADGYSKTAASFGGTVNSGNMRAESEAVVAHLNAHGGIAGRRVVPVFYDVNLARYIADPSAEQQAACAAFTQDAKVYAVATVFAFPDGLFYECLRRAGVITSSGGDTFDQEFFTQFADFFYMPVELNMTRVMRTSIPALRSAGFFRGWNPATGEAGANPVKVGLVRYDTPSDRRVRDQGVKPALAAQGLALTDEQAISGDPSQWAAQYQSAVLRFASQGITHVFFTFTNPVLFMQPANSQRYYPRYGLHSRNGPTATLQGNVPAAQLRGSMGIGWQQYNDVDAAHDPGPSSPRARLCLQLLKNAGQDATARGTALVGLWYCDTLFFLRDALVAAPSFTRVGFRSGAESLTRFEAASTFRSSFAAGRTHDGASSYRVLAFQGGCSCFTYTTGLRSAAS